MQQSANTRNRRAKFIELATRRVNRTIRDLRLISNLSNKTAYEYTEEDVRKIVRALQRELDVLKTRFEGTGKGSDNLFSL
jgi:hypothetical protein